MTNVVQMPAPTDQWQFTVEVMRRPDGQLHARLVDARTSLIEQGDAAPHEKMHEMIAMLEKAIGPMKADAEALKPTPAAKVD